ncbi:Ufd1p [Malassezia vespertilionis]|uniref:Ufd1p n=1 Tax=Malassezia vespertilionis TaxID=2020962 RepID=A0A2N1J705_9BASI|nr:Ufd1p [Malassezia vespertilionis]
MSLFASVDSVLGGARGGGWGGLNGFMDGFDQRFAAPPQAYEAYFKAYHMARFPGRERNDVSYGGKIIMPPSALATITDLELESPWTFVLRNRNTAHPLHTHAGVVEFIAEEGVVYLPSWIMRMLQLDDGDPIYIQGTRLPKGRFVKIQPQTVDFLEISDPKAVLEQALRNYPTLTPGDIIEISYNCLTFEILIMDVVPDAEGISIIETDLEVDFAPPKGYVEPEPVQRGGQPTMASRLNIDTAKHELTGATQSVAESPAPFRGLGQTLSGKKTKGKRDKPITPREQDSRVRRTDVPTIVTNDTMQEEKRVPAALHLNFGQLFFGYDVPILDVPAPVEKEEGSSDHHAPRFTGTGNLLAARKPDPIVIDSE